jgi:hypothetical protein
LHAVVNTIGIKLYGEGDWKVRNQGWCKQRTWCKLPTRLDDGTGGILAAAATANNLSDGQLLPDLLHEIEGKMPEFQAIGLMTRLSVMQRRKATGRHPAALQRAHLAV